MRKMKIRVMTAGDYDAVWDLWMQTPGMGLNPIDDSRAGIEKYLKRNPSSCFVAEEMGKLLGAILAGHDGRRGYIYHAAVASGCRGRGIGKQLVEHIMAALEAEGIQKAALVAFKTNDAGNGFWERIGFTEREDLVYRNKYIGRINEDNSGQEEIS